MEITHPIYNSHTNNISPKNCNLYHFRTLYNTSIGRDDFIISTLLDSIPIIINNSYLIELSFSGYVDAQANTNSVVTLRTFGFIFLSIRAYEPPVPLQINKMQIIHNISNTTPISWDPNPIQFRIIGCGTILITPINL